MKIHSSFDIETEPKEVTEMTRRIINTSIDLVKGIMVALNPEGEADIATTFHAMKMELDDDKGQAPIVKVKQPIIQIFRGVFKKCNGKCHNKHEESQEQETNESEKPDSKTSACKKEEKSKRSI